MSVEINLGDSNLLRNNSVTRSKKDMENKNLVTRRSSVQVGAAGMGKATKAPLQGKIEEKQKEKKKFAWKKFFAVMAVLLFLAACGGLAWKFGFTEQQREELKKTIDNNTGSFIPKLDPQAKKDSSGENTNILLIGIDTREKYRLLNTDTIMVASYNYATNSTSFISIPRDFYLGYPWGSKINGVYALSENNEEGSGIPELQAVIEEVLGIEIQYNAMIDLKGFTTLVDELGGVEVDVPTAFSDGEYPNSAFGYDPVSFKTGLQTMNGDLALKYARSRKGNNGEGGDYQRARRQQRVIKAILQKMISTEGLLDIRKYDDFMEILQNNLKMSDTSLEEKQAALLLISKYADMETYSFVLDPNIVKLGYVIKTNCIENLSTECPAEGLNKYTRINSFVDVALANPGLYSENSKIYIYDGGLGNKDAAAKVKALQVEYPFLNIVYMGKAPLKKAVTESYAFLAKDKAKPVGLDFIADELNISNRTQPVDSVNNVLNGEDIIVILGPAVEEESKTETLE